MSHTLTCHGGEGGGTWFKMTIGQETKLILIFTAIYVSLLPWIQRPVPRLGAAIKYANKHNLKFEMSSFNLIPTIVISQGGATKSKNRRLLGFGS
jgi:hypothetical protein